MNKKTIRKKTPGPGGKIFLKITLFNSVNGPKIVLKSVIYHLDPGPDGKFFLKVTKYFYLKKKIIRTR
jgi:hypothetical protein